MPVTNVKVYKGTEKRATQNVQLVLQHCCKTSWIAMLRVLPPMFKPVNNLICCKTFVATSLSNSFRSNVARQVVRFCCPFFRTLKGNNLKLRVLIDDTISTFPNGEGTVIFRGHGSQDKVYAIAGQRKYLHFLVILRPWVLVRLQESNPRPPALQSSALPTEQILPRSK